MSSLCEIRCKKLLLISKDLVEFIAKQMGRYPLGLTVPSAALASTFGTTASAGFLRPVVRISA